MDPIRHLLAEAPAHLGEVRKMSAIAATGSSSYIATLLDNIAASAADGAQAGGGATTADHASPSRRLADSVDLSDHAKQVLARAETDKAVADRLAAFVQSLRNTGDRPYGPQSSSGTSAASSHHGPSFEELAGLSEASSTTVTIAVSGGDIAEPNGADSPNDGGIHPAHSFSNTLSFGDFYITAKGDSLTDNSDVEIYAKNLQASSVRWGGYSGTSGVGDGGTGQPSEYRLVSGQYSGNRETFLFARSSAAASAVAVQDANGSAVEAVAAAESDLVAITVDFNTGQISASEVHSSAYATLAGVQRTA